ncbi:MAG: hypothetical protein R3D55_04610 [Chloroflexota bacterium]
MAIQHCNDAPGEKRIGIGDDGTNGKQAALGKRRLLQGIFAKSMNLAV